jgi:hypothetical protein
LLDGLADRVQLRPAQFDDAQQVLGHHHRRIDDDAEIDRPHRDEVRRDTGQVEQQEGAEQRQRHHRRHDQRRPPVAEPEEHHQHQQHQADALGHVPPHRQQRAIDQLGAVVVWHQHHPGRQLAIDLGHLGAHLVEHRQRVLSLAQQHDALHHVVLVQLARREPGRGLAAARQLRQLAHPPEPDRRPDRDPPDVADQHRRAAARRHGDGADVVEVLHQAQPAHHVELGAVLDVGAAGVAVAAGQRVEDRLERDAVRLQLERVHQHLVLLGGAAETHHVHHPRHGAQPPLDDPVLERLELEQRVPARTAQRVAIDLAHRRRVRRQRRLRAGRQAHRLQPLEGLVAHVDRVGVVLEHQGHHRQPEQRDRAHRRPFRDAVHLVFDRHRHQLLDLLRGMPWKQRDDLHLDVGDVGIGLDRQPAEGGDAGAGEHHQQRDDDDAAAQGLGGEPLQQPLWGRRMSGHGHAVPTCARG